MDDFHEYYALRKVVSLGHERPLLVTAALLSCGLCGETISGSGEPGAGQVCTRCADSLRRGLLRGCVTWDDDAD